MAPGAAAAIGKMAAGLHVGASGNNAGAKEEMTKLEAWVPPSQDKPRERPLVRRVRNKRKRSIHTIQYDHEL